MKRILYFITTVICSSLLTLLFVRAASSPDGLFTFFNPNASQTTTTSLPNQHVNAPKIPATLSFAGEKVPLDDIEIRERLDNELIVNSYKHSATILMIKRANRFFPIIEKILAENNIPDDFKYLCMAESGLENVVSSAGASGYWQFMKSTAPIYGLVVNSEVDERYDIEKSTIAACKYLTSAKASNGSWTNAAAGYNMGINGINNQANKQGDSDYYNLFLNSETSRYIFRILALKVIYENQQKYGFYLDKDDLYEPYPIRETIAVDGYVDWVTFAQNNNTSYKMIRRMNPWIRDPKLYNKERRTYQVKIAK